MRAVRLVVLSVVVALLVLAGLLAWHAWQANKNLTAAVDDANRLESAVSAGDQAQIDGALADLQKHSTAAADHTGGPTWSLLTLAPGVGDDARGVRLVSQVVADLSNEGLAPLVDSAGRLDTMLPDGGQVSIPAIRDLQAPVGEAAAALDDAEGELATEDPDGFIKRLADKYRELADRVADAAHAMNAADRALDVLPSMLGSEGQRNYLLVFQNNAEVRATGGLPGAVSLVTAQGGRVEMTRQTTGSSFGMRPSPVLPLTEAETDLYGRQLGTYFVDANFTPDFARSADLMRARWQEVYGGQLDGVISIDPVALSYVLAATGPIRVGDTTISSQNVVDELLHEVYLRYPDPDDQDQFFSEVARAAFDRFSDGGVSDPRKLLSALGQGADEGRIYVRSFDEQEQSAIGDSEVAGDFVTDPAADPQITVTMNDTTGAKMSYYLRYSVEAMSMSCEDGVQTLAVSARLSSRAPDDAADLPRTITGGGAFGVDPGNQLVTVRLFAPVGGAVSAFAIDGRSFDPGDVAVEGRPVATSYIVLQPGDTADVTWSVVTGADQSGPAHLWVTPSIDNSDTTDVPSTCSG
jgi:hypothetical protein